MKKIEHIGIAVKNITASNKLFSKLLGTSSYKTETLTKEGVKVSFFKLENIKIELLEATRPDSPIAKFIAKRGEGIHHIAFAVENVLESTKQHESNGFIPIQPIARTGADNKVITFLEPSTTHSILVELCQEAKRHEA